MPFPRALLPDSPGLLLEDAHFTEDEMVLYLAIYGILRYPWPPARCATNVLPAFTLTIGVPRPICRGQATP
jgi:hypothetical protein